MGVVGWRVPEEGDEEDEDNGVRVVDGVVVDQELRLERVCERHSGCEEGSCLRLIDGFITQL